MILLILEDGFIFKRLYNLNIYIFMFIYSEGLVSSSIYNAALLLNKHTNYSYYGVLFLFILLYLLMGHRTIMGCIYTVQS